MNPIKAFEEEVAQNIKDLGSDTKLKQLSLDWGNQSAKHKYTYNFRWLGRPIIQYPQDIMAVQELIWDVKPDLIVETGVAHGGSLIFSSSILELLGGDRLVIGVDIEIRPHNRNAIEEHPMSKRIHLVEGSSIDQATFEKVRAYTEKYQRVMVFLDSNHTHEHVMAELQLYSQLVKAGSYLVVFDTVVEDMEVNLFENRPWGPGDNPKTAVWEFLKSNDRFVIDKDIENKVMITVAPDGYLKCIKD